MFRNIHVNNNYVFVPKQHYLYLLFSLHGIVVQGNWTTRAALNQSLPTIVFVNNGGNVDKINKLVYNTTTTVFSSIRVFLCRSVFLSLKRAIMNNLTPAEHKLKILLLLVVYFDQLTGAPHAVCWSKSFIFCTFLSMFFFFVCDRKRRAGQNTCAKNYRAHWYNLEPLSKFSLFHVQ